jgi:hypothetical protein
MYMNKLLKLHGEYESHFWACEATAQQTRFFDILGLTFAIIRTLMIASSSGALHAYREWCKWSAIAIAAQMLWILLHHRSYMRHRFLLMTVHRLRWYSMAVWLSYRQGSPWEAVLAAVHGRLTVTGPITWRAFAAVAAYPPLAVVNQFICFPLPYRHTLAFTLLLLLTYLLMCLPHQLQAIELLGLHRFAGRACMASPVAALSSVSIVQQLCYSNAGHTVLLVYLFTLVGVLLPLHVLHWQEINAKQAFLRSRGVMLPDQEGRNVPTGLWIVVWATAVAVLTAISP